MNNIALNFAEDTFFSIIDRPLKAITSKESSVLTKIISAIAIGILSVVSLGTYAFHSYNFFKERKIAVLHRQLITLVDQKQHTEVEELINKNPALKQTLNIFFDKDDDRRSGAILLPMAVQHNDLEMVKILHRNGADLNSTAEGKNSNLPPIDYAMRMGWLETVEFLAENGGMAQDPLTYANDAIYTRHDSVFDIMKFFIHKASESDVAKDQLILINVCTKYKKDPEKCREVLKILIEKGAVIHDQSDYDDISSEEAKDYLKKTLAENLE